MFQIDEYVTYGRTGVCQIEGIEDIDGKNYYCLRSIYEKCRIKAPVDGKIPIRRVLTRNQANALIDGIPDVLAKPVNISDTRELNRVYRTQVSSQDCQELIKLTMSIYAKKQELLKRKKKLSAIDEAFFKEGEKLLFGELSVALGIPPKEIKGYIRSRVEGARKQPVPGSCNC